MSKAKDGDTVRVHYTGWLTDGSQFDSSSGGEPLSFEVGQGRVIEGVDRAVVGMAPGEKRTVKVPAQEAYGPRRAELVGEVPRENLPDGMQFEIGQQLQVSQESGPARVVKVVGVGDDAITLDLNHPLAGEDLVFELELVGID